MKTKDIIILGIETSCDETAVAVVKNGKEVLSNLISSQIEIHREFGGVVPEIASRKHTEAISDIVEQALSSASISFDDVDAVAVSAGPGLVGCLLVGISYAKGLCYANKKPLLAVNHIKGHVASHYISNPNLKPPFICLVASGGHSHIILVNDYLNFEILGRTRDDAVGEAFDKVARVLELPYPGGPEVEKLALLGSKTIDFPQVTLKDNKYDFSFSGVKTAVLNYVHKCTQRNEKINKNDIAYSFQYAVTNVMVQKVLMCAKEKGIKDIAIAGGVSANKYIREQFSIAAKDNGFNFYMPDMSLCTDNAAMICASGYFEYLNGNFAPMTLNAIPYADVTTNFAIIQQI